MRDQYALHQHFHVSCARPRAEYKLAHDGRKENLDSGARQLVQEPAERHGCAYWSAANLGGSVGHQQTVMHLRKHAHRWPMQLLDP
jgi:hypothetical protein